MQEPEPFLNELFNVAVNACRAENCLPARLPKDAPAGRTIILGAGKAAADMARVAERHVKGELAGMVVTRYGHSVSPPPDRIKVVEASHPVPDAAGLEAARAMLQWADAAGADDRVIFLASGGGSSLLSCPIDGITLEDKRELTRFLLHSGASIAEINTIRKQLSQIKGGALARRAFPAQVLTYVISDVPGDNPADVASGPTIEEWGQDGSTPEKALTILERYGWRGNANIERALRARRETAAPAGETTAHVIASARQALEAAADHAVKHNWTPILLGDDLEGDASELGREHARLALEYKRKKGRWLLLSGGEVTVQVRNSAGRGGPNLEYLTGLTLALNGASGIHALACDTDGIDGSEDNAGAIAGPRTLTQAGQMGLDTDRLLEDNETYTLFERLGTLLKPGPTLTNVNDFRAILVEGN